MLTFVLLSFIRTVIALPTALSTDASDSTPQVGSSPATRSTSEIVWSCVTTIFACTWVAVHPNVPSINASDRELFRRRVKILAVALIAPEFAIIWAANQLRSAFRALRTLRVFNSCHWTVTHGMFLVMGGFMLTDASGKCLEVLQEQHLENLLSAGHIALRHIPESEIMDRSKGDALAKTLVLIQTAWFIAQVISRAVLHLPISELELTTLAFALLNFFTYALWWKKPLDVRYPFLVALLPSDESEVVFCPRTAEGVICTTTAERENQIRPSSCLSEAPGENDAEVSQSAPSSLTSTSLSSAHSTSLSASEMQLPDHSIVLSKYPQTARELISSRLSSFIISLWTYFFRLLGGFIMPEFNRATNVMSEEDQEYTDSVPLFYTGPPHSFLVFSSDRGMTWFSRYLFYFGSTTSEMLIGTLFGSIHCAAWAFHFPSKLEGDLWRAMSLCITAAPLAMIVGIIPAFIGRYRYLTRINPLLFVVYILARLTILVMAFVLLRDLPEGAFQEIQWTTYIPHV
ncbi:hypothetical protein GYMLUDRAFT_161867 [Collybiopsis luxurians FD-317 M1]|uniref:Uncharacterized protein n=1 Tax=Collybiopsis luxurians FD-317 M1 TaxID=944289 RepID=A0A0D0BJ82_9AGAR|nr:hypothetical protein GYMLUDRAFT_161867 [Collybiopsis luxurians FD-317 M1]